MTDPTQEGVVAPATPEVAAPVEQPSTEPADPAPEAETEDSAPSTESGDETTDGAKPKKSGGFQKRIDKLTTEKYEAELRNQQLQQRLAELEKKQSPEPADPGQPPKLEDCTSLDEWQQKTTKWSQDLAAFHKQEGVKQARAETAQQTRQREAQAAQAKLNARIDAVKVRLPDFQQVVAPVARVIDSNPTLHAFLMESGSGPEVAYHLAKNPAALFELTTMTPFQAGRELLKLEERLTAPPKQTTKTPAPIKPAGANEGAKPSLAQLAEADDASAYIRNRFKKPG